VRKRVWRRLCWWLRMVSEELCVWWVSELAAVRLELQQGSELTPASPTNRSHVRPTTRWHIQKYGAVCKP
jgi:hypothetical protein